jgi:oxygen-independent coproporphyrinogen-3 oxidase
VPRTIGLYVHFPFCLSICPYCDFDRQATGFHRIDAYLDAVASEIQRYEGVGEAVHSVFFGGGTPSLMRPDQVVGLLDIISATLRLLPQAEITLEANPGDADLVKMQGFRDAGVNRLSLGVQSLDDAYLRRLGRRHSAKEARQAAYWAQSTGLRLNLDFMYGLPSQSVVHWEETLEEAVALGPDHLSCYLLTLDERVPMGRQVARGKLALPEDDELAEMYEIARRRLAVAGYHQYEISNWAREGQASRHNLTYWRDEPWIGVGAGAASSFGSRRWKNTPSVERYIRSVTYGEPADRVEDETPDLAARASDYLTLGLRLREGVSLRAFKERFGANMLEILGADGAWLLENRFLELVGDRLRVAAHHQLISNELFVRLSEPVRTWAARREPVRSG